MPVPRLPTCARRTRYVGHDTAHVGTPLATHLRTLHAPSAGRAQDLTNQVEAKNSLVDTLEARLEHARQTTDKTREEASRVQGELRERLQNTKDEWVCGGDIVDTALLTLRSKLRGAAAAPVPHPPTGACFPRATTGC